MTLGVERATKGSPLARKYASAVGSPILARLRRLLWARRLRSEAAALAKEPSYVSEARELADLMGQLRHPQKQLPS